MQLLLNEVNNLLNIQKKIEELTDERFNMFRICGVNHYENTHSAIIAELLKSNSSHNFKDAFFQEFVTILKENGICSLYLEMHQPEVYTEYATDLKDRIDIFIKNEEYCIVIENKIYAEDQFEQLKRYHSFVRKKYSEEKCLILYLTLMGEDASSESCRDIKYFNVSHKETIVKWLERCIKIAARSPIIRETLIQYLNHLNNLTGNSNQTKMDNEVIKILAEPKNIEQAFKIADNFDSLRNHIIKVHFLPQLDSICEENAIEHLTKEMDWVNTKYSGFVFQPIAWSNFQILFQFENRGLIGLWVGLDRINSDIETINIFDKLKVKFEYSGDNWMRKRLGIYYNWNKDAFLQIYDGGRLASTFKQEIDNLVKLGEGYKM